MEDVIKVLRDFIRTPVSSLSIEGVEDELTYAPDELIWIQRSFYADGTSDSTIYDEEGHRLSYTDRGGHATSYAYDGAGRLTVTTSADGSTSTTNYDSAGRVSSTVDRNGNTNELRV